MEDEGHKYSLALAPLKYVRYVDDICGRADSSQAMIQIADQVKGLCAAGGFPLAKWQSNSTDLLKSFAPDSVSSDKHAYKESETKILGLIWRPFSDTFIFSTITLSTSVVSERIIISEISQLFNPLGFPTPVVIQAKTLMHSLWIDKLGWDNPVSPQTAQHWTKFREELSQLSSISVPRWLGLSTNSKVEIHGFSDASQVAMAAVDFFLRVKDTDSDTRITFVCSKTRVAPLKKLTIPRLELSAAVLLPKLVKYVQDHLDLSKSPVFLWTDSSVSPAWINSHPLRWKEFIRNWVILIEELLSQGQWRFIPGKENPADCASPSLFSSQLVKHKLRWTGPPWLVDSSSSWPTLQSEPDSSCQMEEKPGIFLVYQVTEPAV